MVSNLVTDDGPTVFSFPQVFRRQKNLVKSYGYENAILFVIGPILL